MYLLCVVLIHVILYYNLSEVCVNEINIFFDCVFCGLLKFQYYMGSSTYPCHSCETLIVFCIDIQLFRERLSEKSRKVHATRPKGGLGIH